MSPKGLIKIDASSVSFVLTVRQTPIRPITLSLSTIIGNLIRNARLSRLCRLSIIEFRVRTATRLDRTTYTTNVPTDRHDRYRFSKSFSKNDYVTLITLPSFLSFSVFSSTNEGQTLAGWRLEYRMAANHNYRDARRRDETAKCKQTITRLFVGIDIIVDGMAAAMSDSVVPMPDRPSINRNRPTIFAC